MYGAGPLRGGPAGDERLSAIRAQEEGVKRPAGKFHPLEGGVFLGGEEAFGRHGLVGADPTDLTACLIAPERIYVCLGLLRGLTFPRWSL